MWGILRMTTTVGRALSTVTSGVRGTTSALRVTVTRTIGDEQSVQRRHPRGQFLGRDRPVVSGDDSGQYHATTPVASASVNATSTATRARRIKNLIPRASVVAKLVFHRRPVASSHVAQ